MKAGITESSRGSRRYQNLKLLSPREYRVSGSYHEKIRVAFVYFVVALQGNSCQWPYCSVIALDGMHPSAVLSSVVCSFVVVTSHMEFGESDDTLRAPPAGGVIGSHRPSRLPVCSWSGRLRGHIRTSLCSMFVHLHMHTWYMVRSWLFPLDLTLLESQSRSGGKPVKFQVACPQNGTAVLKG